MTQKEKAEELINKFIPHTKVFHEVLGWEEYIDSAKECALIAVDEILKVAFYSTDKIYNYYIEVKQEIERL
ncbi:MAG: hypothetical protein RI943_1371 [Bacteroidota bacterium]|jgi:hypothetical protein